MDAIVITGIGMVTPLGTQPEAILGRIEAGDSAGTASGFDGGAFACPVCARVADFEPRDYVSEVKLVRLMNRDAQFAVAAAHLALHDARLTIGDEYSPEETGLFGASGIAGLPLGEVTPLIRASTTAEGGFDLKRFGESGLRAVSPILSFKILSNMPICFVSICENIQGPNGIYTPWEGQGAQAIEAGIQALQCGDARCVLAGGCDVKTHELAFLSLEQQGLFGSWKNLNTGLVPGEGAGFLVLETEAGAKERQAKIYARVGGCGLGTGGNRAETFVRVLRRATESEELEELNESNELEELKGLDELREGRFDWIVGAGNGDPGCDGKERAALAELRITGKRILHPKRQVGDLFAGASAVQVGLGALLAHRGRGRVLADCFGHGSEQGAFVMEGV